MATQKVTPETIIATGQWVNKTSPLWCVICESPLQVVKTSGQRVYVLTSGEDKGAWMLQKSIVFVSDTQEEAAAVHAVSESQYASIKTIQAEHAAKITELCSLFND